MKGIKYIGFVSIFLIFTTTIKAQNITVDETLTPTQLVQNVLINNPCANISNVSVTAWTFNDGNSYAKFTSGTSNFPFNDGIVLTTGKAVSAIGPNTSIVSEGPTNWLGDSDLEQALGIGQSSVNATVLEFDFLPLSDKISFDYIFSSEQYLSNPSQNQCNYTDGFVFLLKKANSEENYTNLAVVPGTNTPVRVNTVRGSGTVCPAANEQYFDAFNTSNHPTNYNGQTKILTAKSNVEPGVLYHIKLVVADQGNNLYDSAIFLGGGSFKVEKDLGDDRLMATNNPLCYQTTLTLDATEPGNNTYQWFKNGNPINGAVNPTYTVSESGTYSVQISLGATSCISTGEITIEYANQLTPSPATIVQCDPDGNGITNFDLTKANSTILSTDNSIQSIEFFEDSFATIQVNNPTNFISSATTVYAQVYNNTGCFEIVAITLQISNENPINPSPLFFCDDYQSKDGIRLFNLTTEVTPAVLNGLPTNLNITYHLSVDEALNSVGSLNNSYTNTTPNEQIIWAKLTNGPDCYGLIPLTLKINFLEVPNFEDEKQIICAGTNSIELSVPNTFQSYQWNDANASTTNSITVTSPGEYIVEVSDSFGCTDTKKFIVIASSTAIITGVNIFDFNGGNNTVTIEYSGSGDYEFSLDGNFFQNDPTFYNVPSGVYTVYVNDKNECGKVSKEIYVLDYPKYFTPNGDGYNDVWKIEYLQKNNRRAQVQVFDRFGKLVFSGTGDNAGWDGTYKSQYLPSSDYWFVITLENNRTIRGHFSLKR
ncbi:choice-of-anchor L domain-containing protein [Flavobacterium sp.]|uniref:T9SS type B sorting domain-containing protein n=1 Tax=Flavobacterium sp. TaxID=239 RepID=UPI00260822D6|nr:choice-of-anchor L domain-containing protein [Flavobacterium sp.]MDD3005479.1 choice-of-anchor L domain-containing protein [Flavobacterium sp.]